MELELIRTYDDRGVNGEVKLVVCKTIELPWRNNQRGKSCIPEGRYALKKRFTRKHQLHLHVQDVPGRDAILLHPANDALKELLGCIAPVTTHTGPGRGSRSRKANAVLLDLVLAAIEKNEEVFLTIKSI